MTKIFCIIPAYNEEKNIYQTVKKAQKYLENIVVVNDGSKDQTAIKAKEAGAKVLTHPINRGQGAALQTGNDYALKRQADIVVHFDGDGQFLGSEIFDLINPIQEEGYEAVFGSRFLEKKSAIPKFKTYIIYPLARTINRIFLNVKTTDPQNGFRALSKTALQKIRIDNDGMAHCSEILYKTKKAGLKFKEVPVTVIYNHFGQKLSSGIKILKDLFVNKLNQ
ncbi:MAG: glycosyltransferase family 2 protein [Candidatus Pacebacteria bacterium]|nr:glycosyltransferase family 2 protein [Candidatus Paceibacterota bacterium]